MGETRYGRSELVAPGKNVRQVGQLLFTVLVVTAVGLVVSDGLHLGQDSVRPDGVPSDALFDWLTAQAVVGEGSPNDSFSELGELHLDRPVALEAPTSRAPGAILLQMPHALVGPEVPLPAMNIIIILSAAAMGWLAMRIVGWPWWSASIIGCVMLVLTPFGNALGVGSQAPLVGALIALTWLMSRGSDRWTSGIGLGVAATLKLFPGLLMLMLWASGRRATAYGAATVFAGLNLAGLMLPEVSLSDNVFAFVKFQGIVEENPWNLSLDLPAAIVVAVAAALAVWSKRKTVDEVIVVGSAAMLLLSPVLWSAYFTTAAVPVVWLAARRQPILRMTAATVIVAWWLWIAGLATMVALGLGGASYRTVTQSPNCPSESPRRWRLPRRKVGS